MSGKPAIPGPPAPCPPGPRLLLYVAEPRLDASGPRPPPHQHPPDPLCRPSDQTPLYYRQGDHHSKTTQYSDNIKTPEFYSVPPQFLKDDKIINDNHVTVKRETGDYGSVETIHSRLPLDAGEVYRARSLAENPMQPLVLRHGQNQYTESVVRGRVDGLNCSDKELVDKNYVNYQLLEQSVTHQSIVNQSISILNQQVGVRSECESGVAPQLVRTADGVVLAVLPPGSGQQPEAVDLNSRTVSSDSPQTITVPLGWRRIISCSSVIYISPSGTALNTLQHLREYLQTAGTCKCGLPCPLRPENAFSFDPKVSSKAYQSPYGAELTKLCNHKRKLLATLSASPASPVTPPPLVDQKKVAVPEFPAVKKKMKKRASAASSVSVTPLMVHRDQRSGPEYKSQEVDQHRTASPSVGPQRANSQPCLPYAPLQQAIPPINTNATQDLDKTDQPMQRSSHYLTVNSGWISQQESIEKNQNNIMNAGMPVLGTNGQVIGVNMGYNKQHYKNLNIPQQISEEVKDEKKDVPINAKTKEEESQIFCGLNQALTPEVMQKINEQQQRFIQQNKNQIEMAMKGYRSQMEQSKPMQNQYMPQGQLVIQNGAVVKSNPAKTPPWQVKRNDSMTSPNPKSHKSDSVDFDESNTNLSEESTSSNSSFHGNEMMCTRVPPLPQHYNMMGQQWPGVELNKKKPRNSSKGAKKKASTTDKTLNYDNNGMRHQDPKGKCEDNVPSFMDDPSGYLAQQTALLNNTISRQVGINSSFENRQYDGPNHFANNLGDRTKLNKPSDVPSAYRSNMVPNASPSPNNTPDSSVYTDKNIENSIQQCCKDCNIKVNPAGYNENQIRRTYMKNTFSKMDFDGASGSPKHSFEDSPVTSSTYIDRSPMVHDSCGPIQAGTVSTSNVSPAETLQQPEPSPTPSNSSRNTDTPQSNGSNNSQIAFSNQSPAYSNPGSCKDSFHSNPSTPGSSQSFAFNMGTGPSNQSITGTQMMHFISNHNVNKNLMEVDNISMVGVKPGLKPSDIFRERKRVENSMPGYCPPPHLGGGPPPLAQPCYVQAYITTMASGFSVTRDTVTSVLAGRANTATTSINSAQANFMRQTPPPCVNLATTYAIPNNQPDPFLHSVNLPTSYPLHIAGTTAQNMISKSPLEMVQNVIGSIPSRVEAGNTNPPALTSFGRRGCRPTNPGQILISSTGQISVSSSPMPPPPPKTSMTSSMQVSNAVTNVTTSVNQVATAVGGGTVNPPTVVVNTLPSPFVLQPPVMAVDGPVVQQNSVLQPQIIQNDTQRQIEVKGQSFMQGVAMLSPESLKRKSKKKKSQANVTNVLQITAPQQNNIMVHHTSPQHNTSPQFSPRGFQLSPNNNISATPMLQALTIVPGKSGSPAHIVMNGQGNSNNFGSQQIITNTSPSQQINLLQPVNLINNGTGVMPNFPAFQQFIVPNLGGMVMTADGTAIIQDNGTGMPMQLQIQTINGQNVLTPVQNSNVFTAGANGGVVLRAQNQQGKIIQSQHSPGAQFLSPNSQVMMNSPNFNGQLSPLLANLSPPNVTFNTSPQQMRSGNVQAQEFIQTNQMGQTLMVPLSPKQQTTTNRSNSTFVQQNTTIVQQQTTLVSNSHNNHVSSITTNLQGTNASRLSIDPNILLNNATKQINHQVKSRNFIELPPDNQSTSDDKEEKFTHQSPMHSDRDAKIDNPEGYAKFMNEFSPMLGQMQANLAYGSHVRHSVSTQTLVNQQRGKSPNSQAVSGSSPPDTTTHSPLGALESTASSPRLYGARSMSTQGNYADTTTKSPEPTDSNSSAMVQCVSSSEQDMAESRDLAWPGAASEFSSDSDTQSLISNIQLMRQNRQNSVESSELHYGQTLNSPNMNQQGLPITPNYCDRSQSYKRKNEFTDRPTYGMEKMMRTTFNMVHGAPKEEYDVVAEKTPKRHYSTSGSDPNIQKVFERHSLGGNDTEENDERTSEDEKPRRFEVGDLIWGPVKGYASWPGKLVARGDAGRWSVRWFGGDKPGRGSVEHARLLTLSEGLEAHHAARTKHRKSRKLNTLLENAIQEAMSELDKKSDDNSETPTEATAAEAGCSAISDTPKRSKKKSKERKKPSPLPKLAPNTSKTGEGARLRSAR